MEPPLGCDDEERDLFVSPRQFELQMSDLAERGFHTVALERFHDGGDRSVLITVDDAYAHVDEIVTPILQRHGFSAVMFAPSAHLGGLNTWDAKEHPRLRSLEIASAEQIRSMA